jgi:hypothetical protein
VSRAKSAKDAKVDFDKKRWDGWGLCELSVLGEINCLKLILFNNSLVSIYVFSERCAPKKWPLRGS